MATVFEEISLKGLRKAHLQQLVHNIEICNRVGIYYGHKQQYLKRQRELLKWAKDAMDYAYSEGVKLPK